MIRDGRRFNFTIIENDIIDDIERFDKNDLLCYMVLCRFANNETGECYPSYKTIAEKMRVGVSTAIKAVKSLIDKGVVEVQQRKNENGGDTSNLYTIVNINKDNENKKASTVPPVKADKEIINFDNNSIPQNEEKNADKNEKNKESEIVEIINNSCVNIRKQDLKKCEEEFTDIDKLKKALEICEINIASGKKSHGIKALRLAYKYGDRSSNTNADNDKRKGSIYMADSKVDVNGELKSVEDMSSEDIAYKLDLKNGTNWSGRNPNAKGIFKANF